MVERVTTRRRLVAALFGAFTLAILLLSLLPHKWHGTLVTPPGVPAQNVVYTCGPAWGSDYVHGPTNLQYPVSGTPCGDREQLRFTGVLDVALGLSAVSIVVFWTGQSAAQDKPTGRRRFSKPAAS
jgi:hypothetical protein